LSALQEEKKLFKTVRKKTRGGRRLRETRENRGQKERWKQFLMNHRGGRQKRKFREDAREKLPGKKKIESCNPSASPSRLCKAKIKKQKKRSKGGSRKKKVEEKAQRRRWKSGDNKMRILCKRCGRGKNSRGKRSANGSQEWRAEAKKKRKSVGEGLLSLAKLRELVKTREKKENRRVAERN